MEPRTLTCEGRLVATVELADTYGYDCDGYDHLFVFRRDAGYEPLVVGRTERYRDDGDLESAAARVDVTFAPTMTVLADLVDARWPRMSEAWWQVLESGRHNDPELLAAWVPEQMGRELDRASLHDKRLATQTAYFNGTTPPAEGRNASDWQEKALTAMTTNLDALGWKVRPGPELSPDVEPGGILSAGTVVVGSVWASRFGQEAAVIVRVDDYGEIYARLADADDLVYPRALESLTGAPAAGPVGSGGPDDCGARAGSEEPIAVGDALDVLVDHLRWATPGLEFGL